MTALKFVIKQRNNKHVHFSLFSGSDREHLALCGDLTMDKEEYYALEDAVRRGRGNRTTFDVKDEDLEDRLDWEIANKSQS